MRLIDADTLKEHKFLTPQVKVISGRANSKTLKNITNQVYQQGWNDAIDAIIDNAPTVTPEEFKPLIDKVVDILPDLTKSIIEQLPQIISSNIKCSECSYYKDTWNVLPRPHGKWILHEDHNESCKYGCDQCGNLNNIPSNFCPNCGADMRGKE